MAKVAQKVDYAKRKEEEDKKIEEAMKAREERNSSSAKSSLSSSSSYADRKKELDSQINTAMASRSKRIESSLPDVVSDIEKNLTVEIDSYNKTKKPAFGSYNDTYKSQRERRLNISSLRSKVKAYRSYMKDVDTDGILSMLDEMEKGYDSYLYLSKFKTEDEYNQWKKETEEYEGLKTFDIRNGQRDINELEKILDEYKFHIRMATDENGMARAKQIYEQYGDADSIEALISEKKAYLNRAKHIQEGITLGCA
jgi:heme-degrading monooxygenase HmoA